MASSAAKAQVDLSTYADAEGFLDVQTLTCAQLANTWQGDADRLTAWYSGWYNGLAKKHYMDIRRGKEAEHEVIVYCKANPGIKIIQAIEVVFISNDLPSDPYLDFLRKETLRQLEPKHCLQEKPDEWAAVPGLPSASDVH